MPTPFMVLTQTRMQPLKATSSSRSLRDFNRYSFLVAGRW
jgi:hypothetical protein